VAVEIVDASSIVETSVVILLVVIFLVPVVGAAEKCLHIVTGPLEFEGSEIAEASAEKFLTVKVLDAAISPRRGAISWTTSPDVHRVQCAVLNEGTSALEVPIKIASVVLVFDTAESLQIIPARRADPMAVAELVRSTPIVIPIRAAGSKPRALLVLENAEPERRRGGSGNRRRRRGSGG